MVDETAANYWPVVTFEPSINRARSLTAKSPTTTYLIEPSASWSPDLFGVVRRAVEASQAGAQASAAQLADTKLSMQALLAQNYFQLRAADITQQLLDETVDDYQKALQLTKNRYAAGVASRLDIAQAETQLQSAQTQALDNGITRAQYEHAVAVLLGEAPENFSLDKKAFDLPIPRIPMQVPSELLERRPDIAQAERLVAQANANIGLAIAAYFPALTLTGTDGFSSTRFKKLTLHSARIWSAAATITETIFDGGLRRAQTSAARAAYDEAVANYKQTVLAALQQVEDNLVALRILEAEVEVQNAAIKSADLSLKITTNKYKSGTSAYSDVITAQTTAYATKKTAVDIYSRRLIAAVSLIQALGGGY